MIQSISSVFPVSVYKVYLTEIIQSSIFSHCSKGEQNGCCGTKEKKVPRGEFLYFLCFS